MVLRVRFFFGAAGADDIVFGSKGEACATGYDCETKVARDCHSVRVLLSLSLMWQKSVLLPGIFLVFRELLVVGPYCVVNLI